MSEDEAIKILKEITPDDLLNCWEGGEKEFEAIETILDLYQQEKEKNKKLIEGKFREVADKNSYIKDMYISKDKIADILEKYKDTKIEDSIKIIDFYKEIQKLLKEE